MWNFEQASGNLSQDSTFVATGWAGHSEGKNNPAMQNVPDVGPLPVGTYSIGEPHDSPHTGPYTMDLTPDPDNTMFGRSEFRIHGAAFVNPDMSSDGCIIMPRVVREKIWSSNDRSLEVSA